MAETVRKSGASDSDDHQEPVPNPARDDPMAELRRLLLLPEQTRLDGLQRRLDDPRLHAEDVSRILPDAVLLRSLADRQLTQALMPNIEEGIAASVRRDPTTLADAIFPVLAPAIRKNIAQLFRQMVQSLNQILEHSLSLRGWRWRLEAIRSGKPFAEVVLSHTLIYSVEHLYLIHRATGLLLLHAARSDSASQDPDLMSGMLTAIQDFVRESLGGAPGDALESIQMGELTIWIEQGPRAVIAAVIRGTATMDLRATVQDALDNIHLRQREALELFAGDAAPFTACRADLERCLEVRVLSATKKVPPLVWASGFVILAIIAGWLYLSVRDSRRWHGYVDSLNAEPGIVVVASGRQGGKYYVAGLRDPLAADPVALLGATPIDPASVNSRWEPYQSTAPEFVVRRARRILDAPDGVTLHFDGEVLVAEGVAPNAWIADARRVAHLIPGVLAYRDDKVTDPEIAAAKIAALKQQVESTLIEFGVGSAEVGAEQQDAVSKIAAALQALDNAARQSGEVVRLEMNGRTDQSGTEMANQRLRQQRADALRQALSANGIRPEVMNAAGGGAPAPVNRGSGRTVVLKVVVSAAGGDR